MIWMKRYVPFSRFPRHPNNFLCPRCKRVWWWDDYELAYVDQLPPHPNFTKDDIDAFYTCPNCERIGSDVLKAGLLEKLKQRVWERKQGLVYLTRG